MRALAVVTLALLTLAPASAEDAHARLSADVRVGWNAARDLVERPGSRNTAVRKALATLVEESGLGVEMPKTLRRAERPALIDRIRQAALLARLRTREIEVPPGMVAIPGGVATSPLTKQEVLVADFFLDRLETSREDFARFLKEAKHPAEGEGFLEGWRDGKFPAGTGLLPVTHVARTDAIAFATWREVRLPTAEEWAIARGGCARSGYPWGAHAKKGLANVLDGKGSGRAEGVEGRPGGATPTGILRLAGNVSEWTSSPWGPSRDLGVAAGESFLSMPGFTRVIQRKTRVTTRRRDLGFRCAAPVPAR